MTAPRRTTGKSRQILLDAASSLMSEKGSIDVSLSDIAQRAGLNSALVKYYFGSKQGLYRELALSLVEAGMSQMASLLTFDLSPAEKLKIHIKGFVRLYFRYPFLNRLIHAMLDDPEEAKTVAEKITRPLVQLEVKLLSQGIDEGKFKSVDTMLFYFIIVGACDQIFFARNSLKYAFDIPEITEDLQRRYASLISQLVLEGLQTD